MTRPVLFATFVGTVIAANWALGRYGIVPVGLGLEAPAGVYFAGLAFGLRDALHELAGRAWVLAAIATGAAVSYLVEDAATIPGGLVPIAVASAAAFTLSEIADLAVYEPMRRRAHKVKVETIYHGHMGMAAAQGHRVDAFPGAITERRTPYTDHRWWITAVAVSNVAGAVVDSALFLWLAFGSLDHLAGNVWGKTLMVAVAIPIVWGVRRAVPRDRLRTEGA